MSSIGEEMEVVQYAQIYLDAGRQSYRRVATICGHTRCPKVAECSVCHTQLLFSLPFTTAKVERLFSQLKLIKTDRRTRLNQSTLSDHSGKNAKGPTDFCHFSSDFAFKIVVI